MTACIEVVEGVKHHIECRKPVNVELAIFDVGMVGFELGTGLELVGHFLCNLDIAPKTVSISFERTELDPGT